MSYNDLFIHHTVLTLWYVMTCVGCVGVFVADLQLGHTSFTFLVYLGQKKKQKKTSQESTIIPTHVFLSRFSVIDNTPIVWRPCVGKTLSVRTPVSKLTSYESVIFRHNSLQYGSADGTVVFFFFT